MAKVPFDLYGDLEDAYDKAERDGEEKVTETLDVFRLWSERPRTGSDFLYKIWQAMRGDVEAQADVGHAFLWTDDDPSDTREKYKWLDRPGLAQYWYGLAAEAGYDCAQNDLGRLYCPDLEPLGVFKLGRFARGWWEAAAGQGLPDGMFNLARCLRCGKCCCCDRDVARAKALEAEAERMEDAANRRRY